MPSPYRLLLFRRPAGDPLAAARTLSQRLEASGDGAAPGVESASVAEVDALARNLAQDLPGADTFGAPDEPGEYSISWDEPLSEVELSPGYVEIAVWSPRILGRGPVVESSTPLIERLHALVQLAAGAGFDTAYDPEQDRLISLPADAGAIDDWMQYTVEDDLEASGHRGSPRESERAYPYVPYRLVQFVAKGAPDVLAEGRRLAASALARPVDPPAGTASSATLERVVAAAHERFECDLMLWSAGRDQVAIVPIDEGGWLWLTPSFAIIGSDVRGFEPVRGGKALGPLTRLPQVAGFDAVYDPQLDRLVTFPDDAAAVSQEWSARYRRAMAEAGLLDAGAGDHDSGRVEANHALGRGERPGFFSRLFGRG